MLPKLSLHQTFALEQTFGNVGHFLLIYCNKYIKHNATTSNFFTSMSLGMIGGN